MLLLEIATGQALEVPDTFLGFHEQELVDYADAALAVSFAEEWTSTGQRMPGPDECVGYRVPLFLGGRDDVTNLELTDAEVYWSVTGQLVRQVQNLPPGTPIGSVTMED